MEKDHYITWKTFINILMGIIMATGGAMAWGWSETRNEIQNVELRMDHQIQRIEDKLDIVLDYLIQHDDL